MSADDAQRRAGLAIGQAAPLPSIPARGISFHTWHCRIFMVNDSSFFVQTAQPCLTCTPSSSNFQDIRSCARRRDETNWPNLGRCCGPRNRRRGFDMKAAKTHSGSYVSCSTDRPPSGCASSSDTAQLRIGNRESASDSLSLHCPPRSGRAQCPYITSSHL